MSDAEPLSDESSFYGDDDTKNLFQLRASGSRPGSYWHTHNQQPSVVAHRAQIGLLEKPKAARSFNIYEDYGSGRQLSETVAAFLARLPPYSTPIEGNGPWIYIANPAYDPQRNPERLRQFKEAGHSHLSSFQDRKAKIEESTQRTTKSIQNRKLNVLRRELQSNIFREAKTNQVTAGKWMLFPGPPEVNRIWDIIAHATAAGELGHAAKVAADDGSGNAKARLICVYTEDYNDKSEVQRVLQALNRMGFIQGDRGIYYKADAYTHLEINGGNEWGLKASLYASKDVLKDRWEVELP